MKYLILGASAAGISCAKTIRNLDQEGEITIVSQDEMIYSRCMLHHIISGKREIEDLNFAGNDFTEQYRIDWIKKKTVQNLNPKDKNVTLNDGTQLKYDKLLIATGASTFIPPIKNLREAKKVYGLRNIEDALTIKEESPHIKDVVVLGGGLVGIDAVSGLLSQNTNISLVELGDRILPLQLDKKAAARYEEKFRKRGVNIYTGLRGEEVILDENRNVKGLKLSSGEIIDCGMIIVAAGVRPNISFIPQNTINIDRGILINEKCQTNIEDVYGAGDVGGINPIWPLAVKQGIVAGSNMVGMDKIIEDHFGLKNSLNFMGLQTVSLGLIEPPDDSYRIHIEEDKNNYKKIIEKDGIIYGAIFQGDVSYCGTTTYMIKNKVDISNIKKDIFDIDFADFYGVKENGAYQYVI